MSRRQWRVNTHGMRFAPTSLASPSARQHPVLVRTTIPKFEKQAVWTGSYYKANRKFADDKTMGCIRSESGSPDTHFK